MIRNVLIIALLLLAASGNPSLSAAGSRPLSRPNIIFILADDLGYGDLASYGRADIKTPAIDSLATQGARFTSFYANAPECTPTRTAFLTGRYQQRVGGLECAIGSGNVGRYDDAMRLRSTHDLGLPVSEITIARLLKEAGYATGLSGKWHLGYEPKFSPNRHGFDHAFYALGGGMDYFHGTEPNGDPVLYLDAQPIRRDGYFTDLVTDDAVQFIQRQTNRPFFLYVAYTAPHAPYQGPRDRNAMPLPENSELWNQSKGPRATYVAMIERMDEGVARILRAVDSRRIGSNTVVIFTSDNGAPRSGSNAPWSGFKGQTYEGGIRVPALVRWPGVIPPGTVSGQMSMMMDFSASIVRLAGAAPLVGRALDGMDILRHVAEGRPLQPRTLCWRIRRGERTSWAVRDGPLKLVRQANGDRREEHLFNLDQDPREQTDLLAAQPAEASRLRAKLAAWEQEVHPVR